MENDIDQCSNNRIKLTSSYGRWIQNIDTPPCHLETVFMYLWTSARVLHIVYPSGDLHTVSLAPADAPVLRVVSSFVQPSGATGPAFVSCFPLAWVVFYCCRCSLGAGGVRETDLNFVKQVVGEHVVWGCLYLQFFCLQTRWFVFVETWNTQMTRMDP